MSDHDLLLQTFDEELRSSVKESQRLLLSLDESPSKMADLHEIYRLAHSIKGAARVVGLGQVDSIAHPLESRLQSLVRTQSLPEPALVDLFIDSLDGMVLAFDAFLASDVFDEEPFVRRLEAYRAQTSAGPSVEEGKVAAPGNEGATRNPDRRQPVIAPPGELPPATRRDESVPTFKRGEDQFENLGSAPAPHNGKRLVLVVDDSSTLRMLHRSILIKAAFDVLDASDGLQALQSLGRNAADLVLTDIEMPNMDGLALIRRIRQSPAWRHLPIIVVSQYGRREDREKAAEAGADRYVVKSQLEASRLIAMISELLD